MEKQSILNIGLKSTPRLFHQEHCRAAFWQIDRESVYILADYFFGRDFRDLFGFLGQSDLLDAVRLGVQHQP